jgi:lactoylglutathione lyase
MAFIDLGDQFVALTEVGGGAGGPGTGDGGRHVGVVVEDKEALRHTLLAAGENVGRSGSLRLRDPSGNVIEIVDYRDVQFSKSDAVLRGMGLGALQKSPSAIDELRAKGLTGE